METKELTLETVIGLMYRSYSLCYVDYRESLDNNPDIIEKCLQAKSSDALCEELDEWYSPQEDESAYNIMERLKKELVKAGYKKWEAEKFFEENEEKIKDEIYSRDDSDPLNDLLRNTRNIPVHVELLSNYDCINSHWLESSGGYSYEKSYFGDMVDALNLNPYKVKKTLLEHGEKAIGYFPNKRSRNEKEQVSYEQFYEELENTCCGANLLTYVATVDVQELYKVDFNLSEIVIPKGNKCGIYSSMQGGGSLMEMELRKDVKLRLTKGSYPCFHLEVEKDGDGYNYSVKQVYGVCDSFFGNKLEIVG